MSLKEKLFNRQKMMQNLHRADQLLKQGVDAFGEVAKLYENPGTANVLSVGMKLTRQTLGLGVFQKYNLRNWSRVSIGDDHFDSIINILDTFPRKVYGEKKEELTVFYDLYGKTVVYDKESATNRSNRCLLFLPTQTSSAEIHFLLARAIWEKLGSPINIRGKTKSPGDYWSGVTIGYDSAAKMKVYHSEVGNSIINRIRSFLDKDVSRSVMLYGPPGTGKSTIINAVAASLGKRVLITDVADLPSYGGSDLSKRVRWLQPDVLVINDLDRFSGSNQLLGALEELNATLKLLLVSVNDKDRLPAAIRRPGRFDELFEITKLDESVVLDLLGVSKDLIPTGVYEQVLEWPASFIAELGKLIKVLGVECVVEEFGRLQERVRENVDKEKKE